LTSFPGRAPWSARRVLESAVQLLLAVYIVLRLADPKAHDLANSLAAAGALAALVLERLAPPEGRARKARLVLGTAACVFLLVNLASFWLADLPPENWSR
jgi:hypothetical protein